ncbi:MAG: hypothetical protein HY023_18800 [Chloroflexi bacterium]|nr:hypothetical protein [Chloroflexota bacterium]
MIVKQLSPQLVLFPARNAAEMTRWGAAAANFGNAFSRVKFGRDPDAREIPNYDKVLLVNPQSWGEPTIDPIYDHLAARAEGADVETMYVTGPRHLSQILNYRAYMNDRLGLKERGLARSEWQAGGSLIGLYGRGSGEMEGSDFEIMRTARIEAVKLIAHHNAPSRDGSLAVNPGMFFIFRPTISFEQRVISPAEFVSSVEGDYNRAVFEYGIKYLEVHNEPNIGEFGSYAAWSNGKQFGDWFLEVLKLLRPKYPGVQLGFPGLSPGFGFDFPPKRLESNQFLREAAFAARQADWIGVHNYWGNRGGMFGPGDGWYWNTYKAMFPRKVLMITEFGNPFQDPAEVGDQYSRYYGLLRKEQWMAAAFSYIVSNNDPGNPSQQGWAWRTEDGIDRGIAPVVGQRKYISGEARPSAPTPKPAATLRPGQPTPAPAGPTPFPACQDPKEFFDPFLNRCRLP